MDWPKAVRAFRKSGGGWLTSQALGDDPKWITFHREPDVLQERRRVA
jgi:hypothetical protein